MMPAIRPNVDQFARDAIEDLQLPDNSVADWQIIRQPLTAPLLPDYLLPLAPLTSTRHPSPTENPKRKDVRDE